MIELKKEETKQIYGGVNLSASLITAIIKGIDIFLELGRNIGSSIRRMQEKRVCPVENFPK